MTKNEKRIGYVELRVKLFSDKDLKLFLEVIDAMADERDDHGLMNGISVKRIAVECLCPPCQGREQVWADVDDSKSPESRLEASQGTM